MRYYVLRVMSISYEYELGVRSNELGVMNYEYVLGVRCQVLGV